MKFRIAVLTAAGALLCAGAAVAQNAPQGGPYDQPPPQGYYQQMPPQQMPPQQRAFHPHRGAIEIIHEEIRAGRLSEKEGALIAHKIREARAERRQERQARLNGEQGPPPQEMQQQQPYR